MNLSELEFALSRNISASSSNLDLLAYSRAIQQLRTGAIFVAATAADLPAAATNAGKLYLIESSQFVVFSNGSTWVPLAEPLGEMWGWGSNTNGKLGDNSTTDRCSAVQETTSSTTWCAASAGCTHSSGIKTDQTLWHWGSNSCGQLGVNNTTSRSSPVREITSSTNWCRVCNANASTFGIKSDGSLWSWGNNSCGQLAHNTTAAASSPAREITNSANWCEVSSLGLFAGAVKANGTLWLWGSNDCGQLAQNNTVSTCSPVREITSSNTWTHLSIGTRHTLALKSDGTLWSWGQNPALGNNSSNATSSPVLEITSSCNWINVTAGDTHSAAIKSDGSLWTWGSNLCGQLGDNTTLSRSSPVRETTSSALWCSVSAGVCHTVALQSSGSLWSWGSNANGRLGDGTVTSRSSPVRETTSSNSWNSINGSGTHTLAITVGL
jgi:alpha-tubulin suppressor-like RCC1 family protein